MKETTQYIVLIALIILSFIVIKLGFALIISASIFCVSLMLLFIKIIDHAINKSD
jgi:hypothetical protein